MAITTGVLTQEMSTLYDKQFLERVKANTVFDFVFATKSHPRNMGKVHRFTREAPHSNVTTPLTENTNPADVTTAAVNIDATLNEYGNWEKVSSLFELTSIDTGLQEKVDKMGQNGGETLDALRRGILEATTTIQYAGTGNTANADVAAGDNLTGAEIRKAVRTLRSNKAPTFEGGYYRGILQPFTEMDLTGNSEWLDAYRYTNTAGTIQKGQVVRFHGVDFVTSNASTIYAGAGTAGVDVYATYIVGAEAAKEIAIDGMGDAMIKVKKSSPSDTSNPLDMFSTIGWKANWAGALTNPDWVVSIRSAATQ